MVNCFNRWNKTSPASRDALEKAKDVEKDEGDGKGDG